MALLVYPNRLDVLAAKIWRHGFSGDIARMEAPKFTAVFMKVPEGYIGFVEELPGANTQGDTLDEARENLSEAVTLI